MKNWIITPLPAPMPKYAAFRNKETIFIESTNNEKTQELISNGFKVVGQREFTQLINYYKYESPICDKILETCELLGLDYIAIMDRTRKEKHLEQRNIIIMILGLSSTDMNLFGKDRTCYYNVVKSHNNRMDTDRKYREAYERYKVLLNK
jgi:hypothetical protein